MTELPRAPAQIEPIVRALGVDDAVTFLLAFGGAELYIARSPGSPRSMSGIATASGAASRSVSVIFPASRGVKARSKLAASIQARERNGEV